MTNSNDAAFPQTEFYNERPAGCLPGLTKQEWIATHLMASFVCNSEHGNYNAEILAKMAVDYATALVEALNQNKNAPATSTTGADHESILKGEKANPCF